ncbi:MAG: DUF2247 family protein [Lachnospiraceae bacterium]|nr:DUF2247 family protein [Lachnospiraceae bacterium]
MNKEYYTKAFENIEKWSWAEIKYGLEQDFITAEAVIAYARQCIDEDMPDFETVMKLIIAEEYEVEDILLSLIKNDETNIESIQSKWLFALMYYSYQNANDVFQTIDEVYADFGYPEELSKLVWYMPCNETNTIESRLKYYIEDGIQKWKSQYNGQRG